jgi:hypothetical protein
MINKTESILFMNITCVLGLYCLDLVDPVLQSALVSSGFPFDTGNPTA